MAVVLVIEVRIFVLMYGLAFRGKNSINERYMAIKAIKYALSAVAIQMLTNVIDSIAYKIEMENLNIYPVYLIDGYNQGQTQTIS